MNRSDPSVLPPGWSETTLGKAFNWASGGTPLRSREDFYGGEIPWAVIGDLNDGLVAETASRITELGLKKSAAKWVEPGSVLVAMYGSIGKLGLPQMRLTTNQAIAFTDPAPVHPKYLFYYLMAQRAELIHRGKGGTQRNISQTVLKAFPFVVAPLREQQLIVEAIETHFTRLDSAVETLQRIQANLKRYRASVLKAAVEGRLVATEAELARRDYEPASVLLERILQERRLHWEEAELGKMTAKGKEPKNDKWKTKYKEPVTPDTTILPELAEEWCWATVSQLGDPTDQAVLTGPFGTTLGRADFVAEGVPVLTIGCLTDGGIRRDKAVYVTPSKAAELSRYGLRSGDVLFSRMATVGRAGLVGSEFDGGLFNYHLIRLRLQREAIDPRFFLAYVRGSEVVTDYVRSVNHGMTRDGINTAQLLEMPVPLPNLPEQERIVAAVDEYTSQIDFLELGVIGAAQRLQRLRQSILKWAFEGKLVDQDANDEPATVLLQRIRADRETKTPKKTTRKRRAKRMANSAEDEPALLT